MTPTVGPVRSMPMNTVDVFDNPEWSKTVNRGDQVLLHVAAGPIPAITQRGWAIGRWEPILHISQGGLLEGIIAGAPTERKSIWNQC